MPPLPIESNAATIDLTPRIVTTTTVGASPALAAETIIGTLTIPSFNILSVQSGVDLSAWAAFTIGTTGASARLRIRQTNVSGTIVADTGALTGGVAAASLVAQDVEGFDSGAGVAVYVLTLTVASATAASTVSALKLRAVVV